MTFLSQVVYILIVGYDFSEPQSGKDICDRIICPMKSTINSFCNEGHDILSAVDMHTALKERPVKGVTASVGVIDESKNTLDVKKIDGFSKFNDFRIEKNKLRVWRAYGIGKGKVVKTKYLYKNRLVYPSLLQLSDEHGFFPCKSRTMDTKKDAKTNEDQEIHVFDCHEPGCGKSFDTNLKPNKDKAKHEELLFGNSSELCEGWALPISSGNVRFAEHVKSYLTTKFDLGITAGNKLTPKEVAQDMRRARNEEGERLFSREEWLKESQIKGFFSRLTSSRKRSTPLETETESDDEWEEFESELELLNSIHERIGLKHPIIYDTFNLCEYAAKGRLAKLNNTILKEILDHYEIIYTSKERKQDFVTKIEEMVKECGCLH